MPPYNISILTIPEHFLIFYHISSSPATNCAQFYKTFTLYLVIKLMCKSAKFSCRFLLFFMIIYIWIFIFTFCTFKE